MLGEHAVVYGHPAVAGALDRAVTARYRDLDGSPAAPAGERSALRVRVPSWQLAVSLADDHPVAAAVRAIAQSLADALDATAGDADGARPGSSTAPGVIEVDAGVPPAAGLGSSAALSVAVASALGQTLAARAGNAPPSGAMIRAAADAAERCFHDNPSGIDVALAIAGGFGTFRRGVGLAPLSAPALPVVVGLSGEPRRTRDMVARVADRRRDDPGAAGALARLGALAERGADALIGGDRPGLGALLDEAHALLAGLGVSTPRLDAMVGAARVAGALGAKLTGAGGGGAVIALAPDRQDAVLAAWRALGCEAFAARVGVAAGESRAASDAGGAR